MKRELDERDDDQLLQITYWGSIGCNWQAVGANGTTQVTPVLNLIITTNQNYERKY